VVGSTDRRNTRGEALRSILISAGKRRSVARVRFAAGARHRIADHSSQTPEHDKRRHERALFQLTPVSNDAPLRRTDA
jgi:hypothetical protein